MNHNAYIKIALMAGTGLFLSTLDSGIINIAIPSLLHVFNTSIDTAIWTVTLYTLALCTTLLLFGKLADRFGRLMIYRLGLLCFALSSLLCGLSSTISWLIFFRLFQGISAAMMQATAIALITTQLDHSNKAKAMGLLGILIGLGPILGPALGGFILSVLNWRWIFWLNLPICLLCFYQCKQLSMRKENLHRNLTFDFHLLKKFNFIAPMAGVFALGGATALCFMLPPLYFTKIKMFQSWQIGLLCLSAPIGMIISAHFSSHITHYLSRLTVMKIGLLLMVLCLGVFTYINNQSSIILYTLLLGIYGLGGGLFQIPCYLTITSQFPNEKQAYISSLIRLLQNLGIAFEAQIAALLLSSHKHNQLIIGIQQSWLLAAIFVGAAFMLLLINKKNEKLSCHPISLRLHNSLATRHEHKS